MKDNTFILIIGIILVFAILTNFPTKSYGDRRHLPQDTYTTIGKLLNCDDMKASSINGMRIRDSLGCGSSGGIAVSANVDNSFRTLPKEIFNNHNSDNSESSTQSLNYTAFGQSVTCEDINPASENGPTLMKMLDCQNANNIENSTGP